MKIEEQVLSREQMAHLKELGVDTSDASMAYYNISRDNQHDKWILGIANKEVATVMLSNGITEMEPTYTIGDLIEKLPKQISIYSLDLRFDYFDCACYFTPDWELIEFLHKEKIGNTSLLDTLYRLLCWVAKNHKELIK